MRPRVFVLTALRGCGSESVTIGVHLSRKRARAHAKEHLGGGIGEAEGVYIEAWNPLTCTRTGHEHLRARKRTQRQRQREFDERMAALS